MKQIGFIIFIFIVVLSTGGISYAQARDASNSVNEHLQRTNRRVKIQKQSESLHIQEEYDRSRDSKIYVDPSEHQNYGIDMQIEPSNFPQAQEHQSYEAQGAEAKLWKKMRGAKKANKKNSRFPASVAPIKKSLKNPASNSLDTSSDQQNSNKSSQK